MIVRDTALGVEIQLHKADVTRLLASARILSRLNMNVQDERESDQLWEARVTVEQAVRKYGKAHLPPETKESEVTDDQPDAPAE
jgi:hypothetical protein